MLQLTVGFVIGVIITVVVLAVVLGRWLAHIYGDQHRRMLEIIERNSDALSGTTQAVTQFRVALQEELLLLTDAVRSMVRILTPRLSDFERRLDALEQKLRLPDEDE